MQILSVSLNYLDLDKIILKLMLKNRDPQCLTTGVNVGGAGGIISSSVDLRNTAFNDPITRLPLNDAITSWTC